MTAGIAMKTLRIPVEKGHSLAADVGGASTGPALVFAHGAGQTRQSWGRVAKAAARQGYRTVNVDLRGHGDSDWASDYELAAFGRDMEAVAQWCEAPVVFIGASMGGSASLLATAARPELVAGTVLVDMAPHAEAAGIERILEFMRRHSESGFAAIEEARAAVAAYNPHRKSAPSSAGLQRNLRLRNGRYYWHWDPHFLSGRKGQRAVRGLLEEAAGLITCPILLIHGVLSDVVSDESVRKFRELVKHLQVRKAPSAGHMVAGDSNDAFSDALFAFLRQNFPATGWRSIA